MTTVGIIAVAVVTGGLATLKVLNTPPLDLLRDDILVMLRIKTSQQAEYERKKRVYDQDEADFPGIHALYRKHRNLYGNLGDPPAREIEVA